MSFFFLVLLSFQAFQAHGRPTVPTTVVPTSLLEQFKWSFLDWSCISASRSDPATRTAFCGRECGYYYGANRTTPPVNALDSCCKLHDLLLAVQDVGAMSPLACGAHAAIIRCLDRLPATETVIRPKCTGRHPKCLALRPFYDCTVANAAYMKCERQLVPTKVRSVAEDLRLGFVKALVWMRGQYAAFAEFAETPDECQDSLDSIDDTLAKIKDLPVTPKPKPKAH